MSRHKRRENQEIDIMRQVQIIQVKTKYALDRVAGIILLILLCPIFIIIALLIKIEDRGSIFFRQERPGLKGGMFSIWKFRTMVPNADRFLDDMGKLDTNVNRITRVGRILRSLSLDELPQLINIAKGEMSFVDPRPGLSGHLPRYTAQQRKRLDMKPGVTGLAQINGRNTLKWSQRIEYDLQYIQEYSLWRDLKILIKTCKVVLFREGLILDRVGGLDDLAKKTDLE